MAWNAKIFFGIVLLAVSYASAQSDSGENKTTCDADYLMACADGNGCTSLDYRCDGDNDCSDASDESPEICKENCAGLEDRFQCGDGTCVRKRHVCSGAAQCPDGSDEDEKLCSDCNGDAERWRCKGSSKCISKQFLCDSDLDCGESDPSDEDSSICGENCGGFMEERFQCSNKKCTYAFKVCNGRDDCGDNSDESDETCANCNGVAGKTKCSKNSKCFNESDKCDDFNDCAIRNSNGEISTEDNTDEENCSASEPVEPIGEAIEEAIEEVPEVPEE